MRLVLLLCATPSALAFGLEKWITPKFFEWFTRSDFVAKLHEQHVASDTVRHMLKDTPFAKASDEQKIEFASGEAGAALASFMRWEQENIGEWKVGKIVEAAGADFEPKAARERLMTTVRSRPVVVYSFVDCPWCLLAKRLLADDALAIREGALRVVELEELGREGKRVRAALALATGRTSLPSVFVGGRCVGGYTDGEPEGDPELWHSGAPGLLPLHESGALRAMLDAAGATS